jgi:hypothetical protein
MISFGLVNIPIAVYPATREEKVAFKQLRKSDLSPIRYKKVAEVDDQEVPADEIVKGYEYEKGKWVVLEEKDFEAVQIESTTRLRLPISSTWPRSARNTFTNLTSSRRRRAAKKPTRSSTGRSSRRGGKTVGQKLDRLRIRILKKPLCVWWKAQDCVPFHRLA